MQCALTHKYRDDKIVRQWCRQGVITNTLVFTAQEVLSSLELADTDEKMFIQAFERGQDGGNFMFFN